MTRLFRNYWRRISLRTRYHQAIQSSGYRKAVRVIKKKPFTSFLAALGALLLVMILGSILNSLTKKEVEKPIPTKDVRVFRIGKAPVATLQAQIENNGVVQIVAQGPGIVQEIHVSEGQTVGEGQSIVSLSTNYQGGNAPALQTQLAGAQLRNINQTYSLQRDILSAQRTIATASAENTEQLRIISDRSLGETRDLLSSNENLLNGITTQIQQLESFNPNDPNLPVLRGQQAQLQAGVVQLRGTIRGIEYQTNTINPPTTLASAQKEIALKQLDVQQKALDLSREVSTIQYNLALVQEGIMHPASPFKGTIERINVKVGQNVSPGTVIATVSCLTINTTAIIRAPRDIAQAVSRTTPSVFHTKNMDITAVPAYVSSVATEGQLYTIIYNLPQGLDASLTDSEYLTVDVPIGTLQSSSIIPFIPIDAIYGSQNESSVFIAEKGSARARKVEVGQVYGEFVEVLSGLRTGDSIILNRNIVAGDRVKIADQTNTVEQNQTVNELKY